MYKGIVHFVFVGDGEDVIETKNYPTWEQAWKEACRISATENQYGNYNDSRINIIECSPVPAPNLDNLSIGS